MRNPSGLFPIRDKKWSKNRQWTLGEGIKKRQYFLKTNLLKSPRDETFSITFQYLAKFTTTNYREGETNRGFIEMRWHLYSVETKMVFYPHTTMFTALHLPATLWARGSVSKSVASGDVSCGTTQVRASTYQLLAISRPTKTYYYLVLYEFPLLFCQH